MRHNVKWQVSLSDGSTFFEEKGDFQEIEGAPSPWQRLLRYLMEKKVFITSLSLYDDTGRHWNLPSLGKRPKFAAFYEAPKPLQFSCFRKLGMNIMADGTETKEALFCIAQAQFEGYFIEIWVDNDHPENCWLLTSPKGSF